MWADSSGPGGPAARGRAATPMTATSRAVPRPSEAPGASGAGAAYRRRLAARLAICLALGLLGTSGRGSLALAGAGAPSGAPRPAPASVRLRGASGAVRRRAEPEGGAAEAEADAEDQLRARVAELEKKLGERVAEPAQASAAKAAAPVPVNPAVEELWQAVLRDLPELEDVDAARLGMMPDKQYVFQAGDASTKNPIYRRKYEVLGMTLNQQQNYMKMFNKAVRKGKDLDSVKAVIEMQKKGIAGLDKKEVKVEVGKLTGGSRLASLFFRDVIPEILDDPVANTLGGLIASVGLIVLTLLVCFCFFPPIPQE